MSKQKNIESGKLYSVVQFKEIGLKLYEAIFDGWFVDNDKNACYWPPKGKSFKLRALNKEQPESSWAVEPCIFISGDYATYNAAFNAAKQKIGEFNTSSADDHFDALKFRRKHPVLALSVNKSFENLFSKSTEQISERPDNNLAKKQRQTQVLTLTQPEKVAIMPVDIENVVNVQHAPSVLPKPQIRSTGIKRNNQISLTRKPKPTEAATKAKQIDGQESVKCVASKPPHSKLDSYNLKRFDHESGGDSQRRSRSISRYTSRPNQRSMSFFGSQSSRSSDRSQSSRSSDQSRHSTPKSGSQRSVSESTNSEHSKSSCSQLNRHQDDRSISNSGSTRPGSESRHSENSKSSLDHRTDRSRSSISNSGSMRRRNSGTNSKSSLFQRHRTRHFSRSSSSSSSERRKSPEKVTENRISSRPTNNPSTSQWIDPRSFDVLDRRITRMEVTINKIFVMVGDVVKHSNKEIRSRNEKRAEPTMNRIPNGFKEPDLPIDDVKSIYLFNKMLKKKEIHSYMLEQEKEYCAPSKSTNNVVMTAYLKRFISLKLRHEVALKDPKGHKDVVLYRDFKRVYDFLIDVMKRGYLAYGERIKSAEIKTVLRTVWGRTNQMLEEKNRRNYK